MQQSDVLNIINLGLQAIIVASAPPLLIGLAVGLIVSIFQTVTSIQEQTLTFVPKILAVFVSLVVFGTFIINTISKLFIDLYSNIANLIK